MKIDIVAPPFSGHLYPLVELVTPLKDHPDYEFRFLTGPNKVPLLRSLGFAAAPILADDPEAFERIANPKEVVGNDPRALYAQFREPLALFPRVMEELRGHFTARETELVIADFVAVPAGVVCSSLGLPWITTMPTPFAVETRTGTPSYMGGLMHASGPMSKLRDFFARGVVRAFKTLVGLLCRKEFRRWGIRVYRPDGSEMAYSPYAILGLGMEEFEFPRDWPGCFRFAGPCCASPTTLDGLEFPEEGFSRRVLVTLGTHIFWAKEDLIEKVRWLAAQRPEVLFVIALNKELPDTAGLPDNVQVFETIPYTQYLSQFDAVIHHGGAGITYNCVRYEKPSLVVPHDYDQFDFAARIVFNEVGLQAGTIDSVEALAALDALLDNPFADRLRTLRQDFLAYDPSAALEAEIKRLAPTLSSRAGQE